MGGLKAAERPRRGFMNGGSSTRRGARLTVTGKLALIRKGPCYALEAVFSPPRVKYRPPLYCAQKAA